MQYLDAISKMTEQSLSVHFQGKPFNITVIQVYAPTSNAEESEVERFYEELQDLLELTPRKDILFIIGDWNAKVESQETPGCSVTTVMSDFLQPHGLQHASPFLHYLLEFAQTHVH